MDASPSLPESVSDLLTTLADPQRQRVLQVFFEARSWELGASDIAARCQPLSRPAVSHHLAVMRRSKVLTSRKEGKRVYYAINRGFITQSLQSFLEFLDICCPEPDVRRASTTKREAINNV